MSEIAIRVENLSKLYHIGARQRHDTLRDAFVARFRRSYQSANSQSADTELWALRDVSFEVRRGEVVGVVGRNGAGKSTLLKILSRITEPTKGQAEIHGRVGSLLEVGTGFHPELTGRENVYLNGAILGMRRTEIETKFDEIVAFAEIAKFLDTPVKRYSSGMYVRLAFAVAAHLEPEILLVDEVLAVGDAAFQQKCLGKMGDVAREGRTVLFVSHNMPAVKSLCKRGIWLRDGCISYDGTAARAVESYLNLDSPVQLQASRNVEALPRVRGNGAVRLCEVTLRNPKGEPSASFAVWEPIALDITARSDELSKAVSFWVLICSGDGTVVLSAFQFDWMDPIIIDRHDISVSVCIDPNGLCPGEYSVSAGAFGRYNEFYDWVDHAVKFEIRREFYLGKPFDERLGDTTFRYRWRKNDQEVCDSPR